jgi:hypothetical protein
VLPLHSKRPPTCVMGGSKAKPELRSMEGLPLPHVGPRTMARPITGTLADLTHSIAASHTTGLSRRVRVPKGLAHEHGAATHGHSTCVSATIRSAGEQRFLARDIPQRTAVAQDNGLGERDDSARLAVGATGEGAGGGGAADVVHASMIGVARGHLRESAHNSRIASQNDSKRLTSAPIH